MDRATDAPCPAVLRRSYGASWLALGTALVAAAGGAGAQETPRTYPVSAFLLSYGFEHPAHPPIEELLALRVALRPTRGGYIAPRPFDPTVELTLGALPEDRQRFFPSGLRAVSQAIVDELERRGIGGVVITVPEIEEGAGTDLRPRGATALALRIWTTRVADVTTFADGRRFGDASREERTDHPAHAVIRERSPVQPDGVRDLLRIDDIEHHAMRASRHPGRRVDAELAPGRDPGTTSLTYRVAEDVPWLAYAGWSNTGTDQTTRSRPRFGVAHHQLSGRDDVLRLDYVSGDFDAVHALFGSYELGVPGVEPLRARVEGSWSDYRASEVDQALASFDGEQWEAGLDLAYNVLQHRELFVDARAGLRWLSARVDNNGLGTRGESDFFLPRVGVVAERTTLGSQLAFDASVEFNAPGVAGTRRRDLERMGRTRAARSFARLRWDGAHAFYLEPLLDPDAWRDPSTPLSSSLAHEVSVAFRGQYTFRERVAPQFEGVAGGLYSVRGYEQSLAAGDLLVNGQLEYRFHLPRALLPEATPRQLPWLGAFRAAPQYVYGRPDWDLMLRAFVDLAWVEAAKPREGFEVSDELVGVGAGLTLQLLRNLSARYDVGVALTTAGGRADEYGVEHHVAVTLIY